MTPLDHDPDEGCEGCPFHNAEVNDTRVYHKCALHPGLDDEIVTSSSRAPDWCPLRTGPVVVVPPGWTSPGQQTGGARRITIAVRERRELVRTFSARTDAEAQAAFARFVETGRCW